MAVLKYSVETQADWDEHLYHVSIPVRGGVAETDDPLAIEGLLWRGFELVEEAAEAVVEAAEKVADAVVAAAEAVVADVEDALDAE